MKNWKKKFFLKVKLSKEQRDLNSKLKLEVEYRAELSMNNDLSVKGLTFRFKIKNSRKFRLRMVLIMKMNDKITLQFLLCSIKRKLV